MPSGLTLLELLVALGIGAVLASTAVLEYQAVRAKLAVATAAQQVAADLRAARVRAVAASAPHRLTFTAGAIAYVLQRRTGGQYVEAARRQLPGGVQVVDCSARDGAISFTARGTASSFGTLIIANDRGERRGVVVDIAGRVRVQ
jgi:prepilin-type N-terminal cleavage/methylation domain-containing protein